ncbi:SDR family NAD(P)-dependent oxidoreductase [candidate division KSB1 bacterium]|nr:SDR family NAD(P)-dependent oxidoreductase [candidate division KSB1 bacterium]RQW01216.1 MAG: SDR family NAD(P)-dependent oxidoreductase [candidate division KSB1 bacterium]
MKLNNKTILITGASSGIGAELAIQLAAKGNRLVLLARRCELLLELVQQLAPHAHEHLYFHCDVSDPDQVKDICDWITKSEVTIDVLILNAGFNGGFSVKEIDLDLFRQHVEVNFFGAVYFIKYLVPEMIRRKSGLIAVNGSLAGYRGMPKAAAYSAAKGALMNFIDSIRIDLYKYNIHCTLISPGFVKTPITDRVEFYMPFMMSVDKATHIIVRGLERAQTEIRFPWPMVCAAQVGRLLPNRFYAWLMQSSRR